MSNRPLTEQQQRAVETRGVSVALTAGAGSGKTTVLTQRYLWHLEHEGLSVRDLVAITFTEKAATEMRKRIRGHIEKRAADEPSWREHLRDLETASISTIHSFCGQLLRQFSVAAGLDPQFQVLEEVVAPNLRADAVRDTLFGLLTATEAEADALRELVRWFGWPATRGAVAALLFSGDRGEWESWLAKPQAAWVESWLNVARPMIIEGVINDMNFGDLLRHLRSPAVQASKAKENAAVILDELPALARAKDPARTVQAIIDVARVQGVTTAKDWTDKRDFELLRDGFGKLRKDLKDRLSPLLSVPDNVATAAEFGHHFLRVAAACDQVFAQLKRERSLLDFDDLIVRARDLLRDHKGVRAACQKCYRRLLVDELQDTDPVQMEFIELLAGTGLTAGGLFAVGDAKQSIYGFRGADVSLFEKLRQQMPDDGRQSLTTNFRSQPAILHFVNAMFAPLMANYEPLLPQREQVTAEPCVEFLWSEKLTTADASRQQSARAVAQRLARMIDDRELLSTQKQGEATTPRAVQAGDVVLLFRSMTHVAMYEQALEEAGLDYYVVGGRAFYAQQEIYDWLDLFRTLENPLDSLCLASVLRSPFGCLSDDALYLIARHERGMWAALNDAAAQKAMAKDDRAAALRIVGWLVKWREVKDRVSLTTLMRTILADCGYDAALQYESLGERKLANLWKLMDIARSFDAAGGFTLADFVRRLELLVQEQPKEEQAATQPAEAGNVVRLMSIHQAKGLEFPVVVLPEFTAKAGGGFPPTAPWDRDLGCVAKPPDEEPPPFPDYIRRLWNEKEKLADKAEELRLFYVAATRAEDYLILAGPLSEKPENPRAAALFDRFDVTTSTCKSESINANQRPSVRVTQVGQLAVQPGRRVRRAPPKKPSEHDAAAAMPV